MKDEEKTAYEYVISMWDNYHAMTYGRFDICDPEGAMDYIKAAEFTRERIEQIRQVERGDLRTTFTNHSRRLWSEEECRIMVNASLAKLIDDAGGLLTISVADMFRCAQKGTLAMALSDDDKVLTLTRVKEA